MTSALPVWYLMRSSGVVALVLLTVAFALGIATSNRFRPQGSPLYVVTAIHRNASLLSVAFLTIHVVTAVADRDAAVRLASVVLPFGSSVALAVGALSFDVVAALVVTSLLRRRLSHRLWRAIHWSAYAAWPLAVWHGLGLGTDRGTWWLDAVTVACIGAMSGALTWRLFGPPGRAALTQFTDSRPGFSGDSQSAAAR